MCNMEMIAFSEKVLYVDQTLAENGAYQFKSLQDAVAAARPGTREEPTRIYLAPDVYWVDDYEKEEERAADDLIGLIIEKPYITLIGMTGNPQDVVIAADRGQNAGANGNFNTIGVAEGFHAKDLTIGNYCNIDLIYERDASKNHAKRQQSITQAQAVTKAPGISDMDEWYFENCHIVSRLNLFSRDERPKRSLLKDCHLECTDDALGTGYISIFVNCDIELYSNTPCGGASHYLQAFLGCRFMTHLTDNKTITLCKNTKPFVFMDCEFGGDMTGMEWKPGNLPDDLRQIVYHNTLHGQPFVISPDSPELSMVPDAEVLKAFKVGKEYNVYNLLNRAGYREWDPLGQKERMPAAVWNIQFDYEGIRKDVIPVIEGNEENTIEIAPVVLGGQDKTIVWSAEAAELMLEPLENGNVIVKAKNNTMEDKKVCLMATAANGLKKVMNLIIAPRQEEAPKIVGPITFTKPKNGKIAVKYKLSGNRMIRDNSRIDWYRVEEGDRIRVAQTTYVREGSAPLKTYTLRPTDIGYTMSCEVIPQRVNSKAGTPRISMESDIITEADVAQEQKDRFVVDLEHMAYILADCDKAEYDYEWINEYVSGDWYGGFYLPNEYREGGIWSDKRYEPCDGELPFTFAAGVSGAEGTFGLQTTTQGARLVYVDGTECANMSMILTLSPHKTGAQGFGSAKQFFDIYFKYDAATKTGYGLRIVRVPEIKDPALTDYAAKSCSFILMEYKNGVATELEPAVVATAFLPGCTVMLDMSDNVLRADVTTTTPQGSEYPAEMPHEVHIVHKFSEEVNHYSSFGFQHTGTAGAGKSGNRITIHSCEVKKK